jgi:ubiquinone/menaquinone biosynthesis C-methylase UbiE
MDTREAYNQWATQYDTNINRTRDLEAKALRDITSTIAFRKVLEIGCGTGKNTVWYVDKAEHVLAVDLSEEMLAKATQKITSPKVAFRQADITADWNFADGPYDLVSFSLVLEHIQNLDHVFEQVAAVLSPGGYIYLGELHPFKQYTGTKARFDTAEGLQIVTCFNHHVTDFTDGAKKHGLQLIRIEEYFDDVDRRGIPRILALLLKKAP